MARIHFLWLVLLASCSPDGAQANRQAAGTAEAERGEAGKADSNVGTLGAGDPPRTVERPADAPPSGVDDVIGAVPGPCGSTRAEAFLGKPYSDETARALRQASGASEVSVHRPSDKADPDRPMVERRLNVLLNDGGRIILLDCG